MIKYLIIDDEHVAHEIIKSYCDLLPNLELKKHCYDAIEALDYLRDNQVDLIFLDLNMPKLKGFDFLRTLPKPPKVIVTSAYQEHALEGYELGIVDYLLKPFSFERFLKAINKTIEIKNSAPTLNVSKKTEEERVFFYSNKKHIQVNISDILFIEGAGNYCKVILKNDSILIREKISDVLKMLLPEKFIQVHKSFVIAKRHIDAIEGNRVFIMDHKIPIGNLFKTNVLDLLQ
ncbi:MAG: response regulator transcription factor [Bacteroidetes bacterium]|jgi:DNA-binding LytR/AlgR family response regulator|nr:response regulator transcription factor [Bacteroidota bacterium]MDF1867606.1 response regulator transcription factor [Saprospiraceae bacterium]